MFEILLELLLSVDPSRLLSLGGGRSERAGSAVVYADGGGPVECVYHALLVVLEVVFVH